MGKKGKRKQGGPGNGPKFPSHNQEIMKMCNEILDGMYINNRYYMVYY